MTIELSRTPEDAQEAKQRRLSALQGLHGVWTGYPDAHTGESIYRFVLTDADELGF